MTFFYPNKTAAERAAEKFKNDPRIASVTIQFEPYNGFVIVVKPKYIDLSDLADEVEIQDGVKRKPPVALVRPARIEPEQRTRAPRVPRDPSAPKEPRSAGGYSAHACWPIIEANHPKGRDAVIAAVVGAGHDAKTASKQYRHWLKNKGLWT